MISSPYLIPSYSIYDVHIPKNEWKKIYEKEDNFRLNLYENVWSVLKSNICGDELKLQYLFLIVTFTA